MRADRKKTAIALVALLAFGAVPVGATPFALVQQDGANTPYSGWSVLQGGTASGPTATIDAGNEFGQGPTGGGGVALDGHGSAIAINADTSADSLVHTDIISTDAGNLTGDYTSFGSGGAELAGIRFDFYSGANGDGTGAPSEMGVYFSSAAGGGSVWQYDLSSSLIDGWSSHSVSFAGGTGWIGWGDDAFNSGTSVSFADALTSVDRVGIYVSYLGNTAGQVYGVDEFGLTVPEPETYMMLGMAMLSVAVVFRKRITDSLADARALLQV